MGPFDTYISLLVSGLQAYAFLYDQPLIYDDEIWTFEAGCFSNSLTAANEIHFQIDHNNDQRVASTRNALSFADDETGLAFRLALDDVKQGAELKHMVDTGHPASLSGTRRGTPLPRDLNALAPSV